MAVRRTGAHDQILSIYRKKATSDAFNTETFERKRYLEVESYRMIVQDKKLSATR